MIIKKMRRELEKLIESERFTEVSQETSVYLRQQLHDQGEEVRQVTDVLHGKQLGHAVHPILTAFTVGNWTSAILFDVLGFITFSRSTRRAGDTLTALGVLSAFPSALTGMTDYSTIQKNSANYGAAHGLINGLALFFYMGSVVARLRGQRFRALWLAMIGFGAVTLSSWLGGEMVYGQKVAVNRAQVKGAEDWSAVLPVDDLPMATPTRVEVGENPVLLFRNDEGIFAIHNVCSHAGGPLDEGEVVNEVCIACPWHGSVFDMRDGHIVHAPATVDQPRYQVRERDGQIEIRKWDESLIPSEESFLYGAAAPEPEVL